MKKVSVLGPIPRDHIVNHHGETFKRYGAALHTSVVLSRLLGNEGVVHQVSHIQKVDVNPIKNILAPFSNINTSAISAEKNQGDVVSLRFVDQNKRLEKQTGFMPPIVPSDLEGLMDSDAFVCVPITDYEVPLETLKYIKEHSNGLVVFDAHGPTTALSSHGDRILKFWADRDLWFPYIDVLKMNLEESRASWYKTEYTLEELAVERLGEEHLDGFGAYCIEKGIKLLVVTLDENGAVLYYNENGKVRKELVPPLKVDKVVDTTGCGDSFAGGLGYGVINSDDYVLALQYANIAGALRTQGNTFEVFDPLKNIQDVLDVYDQVLYMKD